MAWNVLEPTGSGDLSGRDDAIRANFSAIETILGATLLASPSAMFDTTSGHDHDGTDSKALLGTWVDKSAGYGAQQAANDGVVVALGGGGIGDIYIYTDANANPTTLRARQTVASGGYGTAVCPVKKGHYWKVTVGAPTTVTSVYWIPIGGA